VDSVRLGKPADTLPADPVAAAIVGLDSYIERPVAELAAGRKMPGVASG
jgi:hypothetical protein